MAFFDELSKKAQVVAGVVAEKAKDAAEIVSEKAKDMTDSAKLTMEIMSEQREMDKNYKAIGEWFISEYEGEIPDAVKDVVAAVNASKARIAELEALKAQREEEDDEDVDIVLDKTVTLEEDEGHVCPVCGAKSEGKFCPECGAPMQK